ncbi:MAG: hypothetical protein NWF07_02270, partial [Candidatus Bathyarchaeota archaeon]|nr:hypothetical protein [Candidatus Bathyarchaeota archaeon]
DQLLGTAQIPCALERGTKVLSIDLSQETGWSGQTVDYFTISSDYQFKIFYFKLDKTDTLHIEKTVDIDAFNQIVEGVETIAGAPQHPTNVGSPIDLSAYDAVDDKKVTREQVFKTALRYITSSAVAYNGCATCDVNTSTCTTGYGAVACQVCDACNAYSPCAVGCDVGCYEEPTACGCNSASYGYEACSCNATCYNEPISCTCNNTAYEYENTTTMTFNCLAGRSWRDRMNTSTYGWRGDPQDDYEVNRPWIFHGAWYYDYYTWQYPGYYGRHKGYMFFDSDAIKTALKDSTVISCKLRIRRASTSHGYPVDVPVTFNMHNETEDIWLTRDNGEVIAPNKTLTVEFSRGETQWVDLGTEFGKAFRDGKAKGVVLWTSSTDRTKYAYFNPPGYDDPPQLEIKFRKGSTTHSITPQTTCSTGYDYDEGDRCSCYQTCYSEPSSCTCNLTCYSEPTCSCNQACYSEPTGCTCNAPSRYDYSTCATCNSCNAYQACTCDGTCDTDVCRDCHNTSYHQ